MPRRWPQPPKKKPTTPRKVTNSSRSSIYRSPSRYRSTSSMVNSGRPRSPMPATTCRALVHDHVGAVVEGARIARPRAPETRACIGAPRPHRHSLISGRYDARCRTGARGACSATRAEGSGRAGSLGSRGQSASRSRPIPSRPAPGQFPAASQRVHLCDPEAADDRAGLLGRVSPSIRGLPCHGRRGTRHRPLAEVPVIRTAPVKGVCTGGPARRTVGEPPAAAGRSRRHDGCCSPTVGLPVLRHSPPGTLSLLPPTRLRRVSRPPPLDDRHRQDLAAPDGRWISTILQPRSRTRFSQPALNVASSCLLYA